jgi:protein SCO1/2
MNRLSGVLIFLMLVFACKSKPLLTLPYFNDADFTPVWLNKTDPNYNKLHTIPPFSFTDQNGKVITNKTTAGKIYVANFFFTRCENICPSMMDNMKKAADAFTSDSNVLIISHSVTPQYDSVSTLKKYAADRNFTNLNWHLVTGDQNQVYIIARKGYFADTVSDAAITTKFLHTENFILVDKHSHIRGVYNGTIALEVENLIKQIKILEQED